MRSFARVVVAASVTASRLGPASAIEPPWPEDRLWEQSEIAVEGRVLGVALEAIETEAGTKFRAFRAWLRVAKSLKSDIPEGRTLEVVFRCATAPVVIGGFADAAYRPGERGLAFLTWDAKARAWTTARWNGKKTLEPSEATLPDVAGESVVAGHSTAQRLGCQAEGGRWRPLYKASRYKVCVLPTSDAGQSCTDSEACEGIRVVGGSIPQGTPTTGQCSPRAPVGSGCRNEVVEGVATGTVCTD